MRRQVLQIRVGNGRLFNQTVKVLTVLFTKTSTGKNEKVGRNMGWRWSLVGFAGNKSLGSLLSCFFCNDDGIHALIVGFQATFTRLGHAHAALLLGTVIPCGPLYLALANY
ncbi:uncharacterized protein LOC111291410 [Durio zibethinus]|uniref:Uncharacterized protein LOC111291410 n=1 Tax=Durio zibethinus TaxID=66656 RepID=A0A6P5YEP5_DURZI|nr:uncharacterized protein LOC111291410 [Durio zibethinus]